MLAELKDKLEMLADLLEKDVLNKEEILRNAEEHLKHFATAAKHWENEKAEALKEMQTRHEQAQKDKELIDELLKK